MTKQEWKIGDCLNVMAEDPDNHFDIIITDPQYGNGTGNRQTIGGSVKRGFKRQSRRGVVHTTQFDTDDWDTFRLDAEYIDEMLRVSKLFSVVIITQISYQLRRAGLYGIKTMVIVILQIVNLHGHHSNLLCGCSNTDGMVCCKVT